MLIASLILLLLIIFAGLIFILRQIINQNVVSATKHLEELNQGYTKKEQEIGQQLQAAKEKSEGILKRAEEEAQALKTQLIKSAESERDRILNQARSQSNELIQQAERSRQALLQEIEERIEKEAINKACQLIQDTLPQTFKQEAHRHWVEELIADGFSSLERLRIPQDLEEIKITSAFALLDEQRKNLFKKLKDIFGQGITLKEEVDPKIVAGLVIYIGSLVLDGSLKNKIQERVKDI